MTFRICFLLLSFFCACSLYPYRCFAAYGVRSDDKSYQVDTGAGLVFKVDKENGSISSIVYNGKEYRSRERSSHIASGLGGATNVSVDKIDGTIIQVTIETDPENNVSSSLTHYLIVKKGVNHI